jgi:serine/threonine protein kinase
MIEAGKILQNRYRVEKQIGAGGMGAVYVATDERFGSVVAIKETFFTDEKFRKAFEREARLLNNLKHPALPRVSDYFSEGNGQFLVMEYVDGDDFSEQLEQEGKVFLLPDVMNWAEQLLDALEFLHTQEMPVIHRDIKPQNLKLTSRGQIVLLDFGLAKGNITNTESATAAKSVFGYSRNYASIEQIQGSGTDPRSDLYSLSATLYHLLTGIPPADALTRAMNVLSEHADPLIEANKIRAEIPAGVSRVLHESMALNANQRPVSAKEMRAMLWEVKDELPLENGQNFAVNPLDKNIFTQKTQIHSGASNFKQSEIKTETFSNEISKVTEVKPQTVTGDFEEQNTKIYALTDQANNQKPRRGLAIGAALGGLLLAGSAASAIYVYKPEVFGANNNAANANVEKKLILADAPTENSNLTISDAKTENTNSAVISNSTNVATESKPKEILTKSETKSTETKQTQTSKNESKPKNEVKNTDTNDGDEMDMSDMSDETDEPPTPPKNRKRGEDIPPFVWKKMTPQQRRQLKQALEMERQQQRIEDQQQKKIPTKTPE